ncbi:MAG TPA: hypothetical protein VK934_00685 [Fimbriimonas sp.]|nr:hypothetical protein [Fimbriimonas sp.]
MKDPETVRTLITVSGMILIGFLGPWLTSHFQSAKDKTARAKLALGAYHQSRYESLMAVLGGVYSAAGTVQHINMMRALSKAMGQKLEADIQQLLADSQRLAADNPTSQMTKQLIEGFDRRYRAIDDAISQSFELKRDLLRITCNALTAAAAYGRYPECAERPTSTLAEDLYELLSYCSRAEASETELNILWALGYDLEQLIRSEVTAKTQLDDNGKQAVQIQLKVLSRVHVITGAGPGKSEP